MTYRFDGSETVCAISTPLGVGGIAVLRMSGPHSAHICRRLCRFLPEKLESHRVYFGTLRSLSEENPVDEVLVTYFAEGRSFTGEETIEISCHGGRHISDLVLKELFSAGARLARPGEFTYRAFMNGRLDLVQAESVLSLIESQSQKASQLALRQLKGELSRTLGDIEDRLIWVLAHLEANIDFASEDIEYMSPAELVNKTQFLVEDVEKIVESYRSGRIVNEGVRVALMGRPNVGKSSLLNRFAGEERAIVTAIPGTTRDLIEAKRLVEGFEVIFVDTAGLRETSDEVEKIGIDRSFKAGREADFVFFIVDGTQSVTEEEMQSLFSIDRDKLFLIVNKIDLPGWHQETQLSGPFADIPNERVFRVSAQGGEGLQELVEKLGRELQKVSVENSSCLSQARHFELMSRVLQGLKKAVMLMREDSSPEFVAFELQDGLHAIHEILGKEFDDQVLDRVFKEFCLGK